ncbi:OsmC family protein [Chitinophaga agrisoli]|uniref:OsmC family protein n=1 Tax=Chitinophaga agrisoli TaxID=2607653 RepID=A0A5B2VPR6_9BACT|nr:OsmC family protein [Chitinophaga agrisoli]KAA2240714.1 OsmC family protein [Chitinophaga agrisoli]
MDAATLKGLQAPLKEKYRQDPAAAFITLHAQGKTGPNISCQVDTGHMVVEAGLHPATGGNGTQACSGDMLLQALAACAGVTLNAVATAMGIELTAAVIKAEGDIDFRGTLGVSKETPVGFSAIRLQFVIDSPATDEQLDKLLQLTERYCVVYQTLRSGVAIENSLQREAGNA